MNAARWTRRAPLAIAILTSVIVLVMTRSELVIAREPLNDFAFHIPLCDRLSEAIRGGENPLDLWVSEWTLGHPVPRTYQPLGLVVVASVHAGLHAIGSPVDVATVFASVHWLLLGALPLCFYAGARRLGLTAGTSAAVAVAAPLVSTDLLFGIEWSSTCWRGSGLFTQEWAQGFLPLAIGFGAAYVRERERRRGLAASALLLSATFASHFVYGLIGAISIALAAALPRPRATSRDGGTRLLRLTLLGATTFAMSAWLLVPLVIDSPFVNHSRWEAPWKWDSLGLPKTLRLLVTGDLLDFGRFPCLTLLALLGVGLVVARLLAFGFGERDERRRDAELFALSAAALWTFLLCGRPAWDGLYDLLGMGDVPLHRLIGGTHFALVLLAGIGLASIAWLPTHVFARVERPWAPAAARVLGALLALLAMAPVISERVAWLKTGEAWGRETIALTDAERGDLDRAVALCKERGGRAWSGSAGGWGKDFAIKWTPFHAFLSRARVPQVSFLYHAMALTSDVMLRFDDADAAHWRLFGVRTGVAPAGRTFGDFTHEIAAFGRYHVFAFDDAGMFDVVDVAGARRCDKRSFYDVVDPWLFSEGPAQRRHLAIDLDGHWPEPGLESEAVDAPLPQAEAGDPGRVLDERREGERYFARVHVAAERAWVMLKMTWHPGWTATVDGAPARTSHVTPGFVAVRVPQGEHDVAFRYRPGRLKSALLLLIPLALGGALVAERRVGFALGMPLGERLARLGRSPLVRELAGAALLALLAGMPLLLRGLGSGHDSIAYPPRVVEMHENVRHGILLPRWAPDLSAGQGQPFFLFTPPLLGWLGEPVFAATHDAARALGLPVFLALVVGIFAMRRAAREMVGAAASWVAATAFAMAPYLAVDLHVRAALGESLALALAPVALLGLLRHARTRAPRDLALLALGVALVGLAHHAMSLLTLPLWALLAAFLAWERRDARLAASLGAGLALGVAASACAWLPALLERDLVKLASAREGYFHWSVHLVEPWQLVWSPWGFGVSQEGSGDGMSFRLGPLLLGLAAAAGACAWDARRRRTKTITDDTIERIRLIGVLLLALIVGAWMTTPLSSLAWRVLPLLPSVQFPWRIEGSLSLVLALLAGLAAQMLSERSRWWTGRAVVPALVIVALVLSGYPLERPASRTNPDPVALHPDEIARRETSATSIEELEPLAVEQRAPFRAEPVEALEGDASAVATRETPERWRIDATGPGIVALQLLDFPDWRVEGPGVTKLEPEPVTGRVRLRIAEGTWPVRLVLRRSRAEIAGLVLSACGALGIATLGLRGPRMNAGCSTPHVGRFRLHPP